MPSERLLTPYNSLEISDKAPTPVRLAASSKLSRNQSH